MEKTINQGGSLPQLTIDDLFPHPRGTEPILLDIEGIPEDELILVFQKLDKYSPEDLFGTLSAWSERGAYIFIDAILGRLYSDHPKGFEVSYSSGRRRFVYWEVEGQEYVAFFGRKKDPSLILSIHHNILKKEMKAILEESVPGPTINGASDDLQVADATLAGFYEFFTEIKSYGLGFPKLQVRHLFEPALSPEQKESGEYQPVAMTTVRQLEEMPQVSLENWQEGFMALTLNELLFGASIKLYPMNFSIEIDGAEERNGFVARMYCQKIAEEDNRKFLFAYEHTANTSDHDVVLSIEIIDGKAVIVEGTSLSLLNALFGMVIAYGESHPIPQM